MKQYLIFGLFIIFIIGCTQEPAESTTLAVPAPDVDDPFEVEEMVVNEDPEEEIDVNSERKVQEIEEDLGHETQISEPKQNTQVKVRRANSELQSF